MRTLLSVSCSFALAAAAFAAGTGAQRVELAEIVPLLESGRPSAKAAALAAAGAAQRLPERPRFTQTPEGYLESLSAAPGTEFPALVGPAGQPEVTAKNFLKQHGKLFGVTSPAVDFRLKKKNGGKGRHSIRLTQTYEGIPVFGGETVVQVNDAGGVEYISGNFDRDTGDLDEKRLAIKPKLTARAAVTAAQAHYAAQAPGQALAVTPPELAVFVPALLKLKGPKRLTWKMEVRSADDTAVARRVFIDAHSGEFVQEISLILDALNRQISDAGNATVQPGTLVRSEGGAASAVADANSAYDYLGDTYNFYFSHFQRDGLTGNGAALLATVRYIHRYFGFPSPNASWDGSRMKFDPGWATDDITAHELTHGVTESESDLIYFNESGAINESMSDVFGEFVDLTNSNGNDSPSVRWLIAEDLPIGVIRSMINPPDYGDPDWLGSSFYYNGTDDYGGVHINSGVNNKLCYLLTDGDTFRGYTITGMGITDVAALYYEANVNLLTASSGWTELANALRQAAINNNWSISQRQNLDNALFAVGFLIPLSIYIDETALGPEAGTPAQPAHSIAKGVQLLGSSLDGTFFLRGTGHASRISRRVTIRAWDGSARIVAP